MTKVGKLSKFLSYCSSFLTISDGQLEEAAEEATLWTCRGTDSLGHQTMGYYLDFAKRPTGSDINSTAMRRDLLERHSLDEEILGQLSTADLLSILEPVLRGD